MRNIVLGVFLSTFVFILGKSIPKPYQCPSSVAATRPASQAEIQENLESSRKLYKRIKMWQIKDIDIPPAAHGPGHPKKKHNGNSSLISDKYPRTRSFSLLASVLEVVKIACPTEFVSHGVLLEGAFQAFYILHSENILGESDRMSRGGDPISKQIYERIDKVLTFCQETLPAEKFSFVSSPDEAACPRNGLIRKICQYAGENVPICKRLSVDKTHLQCQGENQMNTNFILDVVWNMIDLAHGACSNDFRKADDITAYNEWEQAMEALFTRKIKKYWNDPGMTFQEYQTILHPNLNQQMHNLEMCVEGVYYVRTGGRAPRLQRPANTFSVFKKKRRKKRSLRDEIENAAEEEFSGTDEIN